ncbi:helix-turn-helix domain-containing protein [Pseudonocardia sp. RS010]|uniref:helix-turn-helix domain-containing protein n=1 Tax=Pseudonocardia sp. RS010 TaxID=3385979 RepID=UPI0039A084E4
MSTGEAARALGVSIRSLQQWARDGHVTPDYVTPGGHYRWDVDRLREWIRDPQRLRRTRDDDRPPARFPTRAGHHVPRSIRACVCASR